MTVTLKRVSPNSVTVTIESTTTKRATGRPGNHRSPHHKSANAARPIANVVRFVASSWAARVSTRSGTLCPPPATPRSAGNCVIPMVSPAPALNPVNTLSLISLTSTLSLKAQATRRNRPTAKGVPVAIWT